LNSELKPGFRHGYDILPSFGVFDIYKNPDIPRALEDYQRHL